MNIDDAIFNAVHDYPDGVHALARHLGISHSSLQHKANPRDPVAHFSPRELIKLHHRTHDARPANAFASEIGALLVFLPDVDEQGGDEWVAELAASARHFADFMSDFAAKLADGRVTDNERRSIDDHAQKVIVAMQRLTALSERIHNEGKPAALRAVGQQQSAA